PGVSTMAVWASVPLKNHRFASESRPWPRPDFSLNERQKGLRVVWSFQDDSDLGAGMAVFKGTVITGNTKGEVYALDLRNGKKLWSYQTGGKIYSTPAVHGRVVIVGSAD